MTSAYVLIQIGSGDPRDAIPAIREIGKVKQAHLVLGPTDVIAYVEADGMEALGETVMEIIAVDGVAHTDTRLAWPL
jgi:hypothetical protein